MPPFNLNNFTGYESLPRRKPIKTEHIISLILFIIILIVKPILLLYIAIGYIALLLTLIILNICIK